jgi:hypothetical protein
MTIHPGSFQRSICVNAVGHDERVWRRQQRFDALLKPSVRDVIAHGYAASRDE